MLVLVSFVLVLAAAVTLVVGLLQSGLTLIYLSIGCSVLAGVVLAVAVLRGRPEPRAAAPVGQSFTPPAAAPPQPATVGAAPASTSTYESTPSWTPPPPPPPPAPSPGPTDDAATKAAGTALLGRLRRRTEEPEEAPAATSAPEAEPAYDPEPATAQYAALPAEDDDGFPIADYDRMRATDLLRQLGGLDRNQLEAVRDRESAGKNRFTIMSRIDVLLAGMTEPAWEAADDGWDDDDDVEAEAGVTDMADGEVGEVDDFAIDDDDWDDDSADAVIPIPLGGGDLEDDEVDELVSPPDEFPIAGYESLTVGQILPRLSDLDADELAQVRAREQEGRARATILDRVDRLASKSGAATASSAPARARKAPARRSAPAAKAAATAPRKARVAKVTPAAAEPAPAKAPARRSGARKAAATEAPMVEAVKKASARKAAATKKASAAEPATKKAPARRKAAASAGETPMKAAVKKARAAKKQL